MKIGNRTISSADNRIFFVAEIGLCHNGDLDTALKLIEIAADAGADAVKFQKRTVDILATPEVLDAPDNRFPSFGATYRQVREFIEFDQEQYAALFAKSKDLGINCFVTPFDIPALQFCDQFDMPAIKIASHSLTDLPLLEETAKRGKPVIMSTGMASLDEIDRAISIFEEAGAQLALLHCVSSYPTDLSQANLKGMDLLIRRFAGIVGFSGHELDNIVTLAAASRGARIIERHVTLDHEMEGFDHKIALDPTELKDIIAQIRKIETLLGSGDKQITENEMTTRVKYRRSIASAHAIEAGDVFTKDNLVMMNPGTGLPPSQLWDILGKKAKTAIPKGALLTEDMF